MKTREEVLAEVLVNMGVKPLDFPCTVEGFLAWADLHIESGEGRPLNRCEHGSQPSQCVKCMAARAAKEKREASPSGQIRWDTTDADPLEDLKRAKQQAYENAYKPQGWEKRNSGD